ncbi:hypothetical protein BDL97_02G178800 [Sphagnum fallax]|nr:hypothetical protein BDL97_02G178800 [Sphagnum fallax]
MAQRLLQSRSGTSRGLLQLLLLLAPGYSVGLMVLMAAASLLSVVVVVEAGRSAANFIFGDSLVDAGNNDYLDSLAKANYQPYGIDTSDHKPTGRFCNGRIVPDLMSESMGMEYPLPVLDPAATGPNILQGVNYASAGAGILNDTGSIFLSLLTLPQQFQYFQQTKTQIAALIGQPAADQLIKDAIYSFTLGGNDYINNYLIPFSTRSQQYTIPQYQDLLISPLYGHFQKAYSLGMRKFTVSNIGPIGCTPSEVVRGSLNGSCITSIQDMAMGFNAALKPMTEQLQAELPGSVFVYIDSFTVVMNIINNAASYGFTVKDSPCCSAACCGVGPYLDFIDCETSTGYCNNREEYVFWDLFHPTERVNILAQQQFLNGGLDVVSPMNVAQLMNL